MARSQTDHDVRQRNHGAGESPATRLKGSDELERAEHKQRGEGEPDRPPSRPPWPKKGSCCSPRSVADSRTTAGARRAARDRSTGF